MKIVMFSNFPPSFNADTLEPKMKKYGVEVVRTINIDRLGNNTPKLTDCDAVISLVEMMSGAQRDMVKEWAKRAGKKHFGIRRKEDETWVLAFGTQEVKAAAAPPASRGATALKVVEPEPPTLNDQIEAIADKNLHIVVPKELLEPAPESKTTPASPSLEEQLQEMRDLIDIYEEENKRLVDLAATRLERSNADANLLAKADRELRAAKADVERGKKENEKLAGQIEEQAKLITQLRARPTPRLVNDINKAIESFRILRRMGMITNDDIVEKLFNFKGE